MFWDKISVVYDLFENVYNRRVYNGTGKNVAEYMSESDEVLECACGTGAISVYIAPKCKKLIATDYSAGMLKKAKKKCAKYGNVNFSNADITDLKYNDASFDKVVAGNVIHLLPQPDKALNELMRVVRPGGLVIIPTYINMSRKNGRIAVSFMKKLGADFKKEFDLDSYKEFFKNLGYDDVEYAVVDGRMPCAIAAITKRQ